MEEEEEEEEEEEAEWRRRRRQRGGGGRGGGGGGGGGREEEAERRRRGRLRIAFVEWLMHFSSGSKIRNFSDTSMFICQTMSWYNEGFTQS